MSNIQTERIRVEQIERCFLSDLSSSMVNTPFASIFNCGAQVTDGPSVAEKLCFRTGSVVGSIVIAGLVFVLEIERGNSKTNDEKRANELHRIVRRIVMSEIRDRQFRRVQRSVAIGVGLFNLSQSGGTTFSCRLKRSLNVFS